MGMKRQLFQIPFCQLATKYMVNITDCGCPRGGAEPTSRAVENLDYSNEENRLNLKKYSPLKGLLCYS